jgi:hypothetical protein
MTLEELIQQGWADHDTKTPEVADRLEANLDLVTDASGGAAVMNLAIHAVGAHLGDHARARRLCESVVERLGDDAEGPAFLYLAVARRLAGDEDGSAAAAEKLGDDPANEVRIGMLVAEGHMHAGDWDGAVALYADALGTAESLPEGHAGERAAAVVSNNIASELLERKGRTAAQDALMEKAAHAARTYWTRVGDWTNDERADYLLSLVHTSLGRAKEGRQYADRGLATIAANGEEKVDQAFLYLARARACRDLGATQQHADALTHARSLAAEFGDAGLTEWFEGELAKSR